MERKRKRLTVLLALAFVAGIALMFYPSLANLWNTHYQNTLIQKYEQGTVTLTEEPDRYGYELEKAEAYNYDLWPTPEPEEFAFLDDDDPSPEYLDCLDINGNGVMGYVDIPKLDVNIPIFHTAEGEGMNRGAGHLEGTSLPIGGVNTHSVIAAHRGVPGAELFTNLDKLEIGEHFFLHVLDETLAYEVDQIKVVEPDDVSDLVIHEGEDYCTLLTCTPYGVNTERLLVRGHRVPYDESIAEDEAAGFTMKIEYWLLLLGIAVAVVGIIILLTSRRRNRGAAAARKK